MGDVTPTVLEIPQKPLKIRFVFMTYQQFSRGEKGFWEFYVDAYSKLGCMDLHLGRLDDRKNDQILLTYYDENLKKQELIYSDPKSKKRFDNITRVRVDKFHLNFKCFNDIENCFEVSDGSTNGTYFKSGIKMLHKQFKLEVGVPICLGGTFDFEKTVIFKISEVTRL